MANNSIIACPGGNISGIQNENGSLEFLGIRYAAANRFDAPVDIDSWTSTYDATKFGSISPQVPGMLETMLGFNPADMDEDCLFLNVYASETPSQDTKNQYLFGFMAVHTQMDLDQRRGITAELLHHRAQLLCPSTTDSAPWASSVTATTEHSTWCRLCGGSTRTLLPLAATRTTSQYLVSPLVVQL